VTTGPPTRDRRRAVVDRLSRDERHGQRWHLQVPCPGDPHAVARPLLLLLGLPTLGLALAISVLTTYGPVVLAHLTSSTTQIGALIGGEGAFALAIPIVSGALSDRLGGSPRRRRLPFVAAGAPLVVFGLLLLPLGHSYLLAGLAVLAFYVGYYLYYPPYRALYADLLPRELYARAQASQAVLRGVALGAALLAGGLLLGLWIALPFAIAAVAVAAATVALVPVLSLQSDCPNETLPYRHGSVRELLAEPGLRAFAGANALWEFSFAGLKSFIVLYVVRGLGHSPAVASAVMAVVAAAYIAGAPLASRLADRHGLARVLTIASVVYGAGLVVGVLPHTLLPLLVGLPVVALAGAIVMTLPQALAFTLAPAGTEGAVAGLQDFSRGVGVVVGPIVVGVAVDSAKHLLGSTHGYAAMWPVVGVPVLLAALLMARLGEPAAAERGRAQSR
jgi:MFS family permease